MPGPDKKEARRKARALVGAMGPTEQASAALRSLVPSLARWDESRTIAAYCALRGEPDLQPLAWCSDRLVLLPRVEGERLVFCAVSGESDLAPGQFGVLEPKPGCPAVDLSCADIVFVPGLAFTAEGARLGRGLGYYDRALASLPPSALRVGVCFAPQVLHELPVEAHDEPVDIVLSAP